MTALWNHLDPVRKTAHQWRRGIVCVWCGRERVAGTHTSRTCADCKQYDAYAEAVEAGEVA